VAKAAKLTLMPVFTNFILSLAAIANKPCPFIWTLRPTPTNNPVIPEE
jgi:hypothetical protein